MSFILFSPVMGIVALMVRFKLGSSVLFGQQRPRLDGKILKQRYIIGVDGFGREVSGMVERVNEAGSQET